MSDMKFTWLCVGILQVYYGSECAFREQIRTNLHSAGLLWVGICGLLEGDK